MYELIKSGVSGWLVTSGSVESLLSAMRSTISYSAMDLNYLRHREKKRVTQYHAEMC